MRNVLLRMKGGLLFAWVACAFATPALAQQGRDFSGGITNAASQPIAGAPSADWEVQQKTVEAQAMAALNSASKSTIAPGQLGPSDKIRVTVFGEPDLSGDFEIDNTGSLMMPLVGDVPVRSLTPRELEKKITGILEQGYLKNARVNIEVLNFRPFFILGEVNKPGSYPYANEMSAINAVALAGGYTTRAKTGQIKVRRATTPDKEEWVREDSMVYPGDVLRVEERFF